MSEIVGGFVHASRLRALLTAERAARADEVRVARLIAHMRPYLPSSAVAATQPMAAVIPAQRRATHHAERRLDDQVADALRRRSLEVNRARTGTPRPRR